MTHAEYISFFRTIASNNKKIAHLRPDAIGSSNLRRSFVVEDNDENFTSATVTEMHFPCMVFDAVRSKLNVDDEELYTKNNLHNIRILQKSDPNILDDDTRITTCYTQAEEVVMEIIGYLKNYFEVNGSCGVFKTIDFNTLTWSKTGEVFDGLYGWEIALFTNTKADELDFFDELKWYS
jgi:hypothetical protein